MNNKKKNNKKILIIIICVCAFLVFIGIFLFFQSNKKELVLYCDSGTVSNQYFDYIRTVNLHKKGDALLFNDNLSIDIITNDEKVINAIDTYFSTFYKYDNYSSNNFLDYTKDGNKISYILNLNLEELSKNQIKNMIGVENATIKGIKNYLEESGLVCEEY